MIVGGYEIERACRGEAGALVSLRDSIASWLQSRGVRQWLPGEFDVERMRSWIDGDAVDVCRVDGQIVAAVAVLWDDPCWAGHPGHAGYIHGLMVDRQLAGHGLGDVMLAHAEQRIRQAGRTHARLDAVRSNTALHDWYQQRGYRPIGTVQFDRDDLFDTTLFEKALPLLSAGDPPHPDHEDVERFLQAVVTWAAAQTDVHAIALVGSWARGTARPGSDVDLVLIVDDLDGRLCDDTWVREFDDVATTALEDWGAVQSWRVRYRDGLEVEYGLATRDWLRTPLDPGTAAVVGDGLVPLHDPHELFDVPVRER